MAFTCDVMTFAPDVAECILYGRSFLKEPVIQGNVLYISEQPLGSFVAEMFNSGLQSSGQLVLGSDAPKGQFEFVTVEDWFKFSWNDIIEATVEHAVKIGACLAVFDTLSRIARVKDENNASEVQAAVDLMTPFLQHGISTLIVQHERKSGGDISDAGRGTGALAGTVDESAFAAETKFGSRSGTNGIGGRASCCGCRATSGVVATKISKITRSQVRALISMPPVALCVRSTQTP
jgi:AAA domain-containing protein